MFIAEAHSFTQQARLAVTLAWIAGYTNIVTVLVCGTVTSHVSGTTSNLGRDLVEGKYALAALALFLVVTYFAGAVLSGLCTEHGRRRHWESIYVLPMGIEAVFLGFFALGLEIMGGLAGKDTYSLLWMTGVASMAMGLQNATITRISSGVVRTTHVSGVVTDLGLELAQFFFWLVDSKRNVPPGSLRTVMNSARVHPSTKRLLLLASIFGSFALGAALGTLAIEEIFRWAMIPPVAFLGWIIIQDLTQPIAEIRASDLMEADAELGLPESLVIYHMTRDYSRFGKAHRMPNLQAWADQLAPKARVIILDFGVEAKIDHNAALLLKALMLRLRLAGKRLILAGLGMDPAVLKQAWGDDFHPGDVCPDLEMAIAHGLILADKD